MLYTDNIGLFVVSKNVCLAARSFVTILVHISFGMKILPPKYKVPNLP
jgi:hypothetical protein